MQIEQTTTKQQTPGKVKYEHVMLVDDNPIDNLVNRQLLESADFANNITVAEEPEKALEQLKKFDSSELPDVIFLDIIMPGMDGFEFIEAFAGLGEEVTSKCKILLLSTSDSFEHLNKANKNKFVKRFLNKPLSQEILDAINI